MNSILERLFYNAEVYADKPALLVNDKASTYAELKSCIIKFAQFLKNNGIQTGDRVIVKGIADLHFVLAIFAIHLCGAVSVPVEKSAPEATITGIFETLQAKFALVDFESEVAGFFSFQTICVALANIAPGPFVFPNQNATGDIMYTTGTTGKSKGIELTHRNIEAAVENIIHFFEMKPDNINLIPVPINHAFGIRRMYANFYVGATVVLLDGLTSVKRFFQAIETYHVNALTMTATSFSYIFRMSGDKLATYRDCIRYIDIGAQAVPNELKTKLIEMLPHTRLYNIYGSSEAGCCTGLDFNNERYEIGSVGVDAVNATIVFMDENQQIIDAHDASSAGYLAVSGDVVMKGYVNDDVLTRKTLKNGFVVTNDIGYRNANGFIYLLGRKGDVINIGGFKVAPAEIEEAAKQSPMVEDCACVPFLDTKGIVQEVPKLFVVPKGEAEFSASALRSFLAQHLELYKVPVYYEQIDRIPRTYNGKIQRSKLKKDGGVLK